jgi:hypothetical protein
VPTRLYWKPITGARDHFAIFRQSKIFQIGEQAHLLSTYDQFWLLPGDLKVVRELMIQTKEADSDVGRLANWYASQGL